MNISHYPVDSNTAILVAVQGTNQSKYLQPDYCLSSSNNSFLGKKYNKVQQIISAMLLSGIVLTTSVDANASSNTYVESIDEAMSKRVERNETIADSLRRALEIRERELAKRELTNTLDAFSDNASVSSGYSGSETASNSDISSTDSENINGSFDFTPLSDDLEWYTEWDDSSSLYSEATNVYDTIYTSSSEYYDTEYPNSDSEYDLSSDQVSLNEFEVIEEGGNFDTAATKTQEKEAVTIDVSDVSNELQVSAVQANIADESEYPNSDSEYDLSSDQVSLNEFEVIEEGGNFDTAATKTQEKEAVTIDVSDVSNELQVSAVQANIADESEVSAPVDQANTENHNTLLAVAETELAISDMANDPDNTALDIVLDVESDNAAITEQNDAATQTTSLDQEALLKKAKALSYISHEELRVARKVASNHIKQRMFERNMLVAVASGDEHEADQSQILGYSVWSSGALGSAKQKTSNNPNGYSSKILGGSIGADVQCENDLLVGSSFSKISSNIKHASQKVTKKFNTYIASIYGTSRIKNNLTLGVIGSAGFSTKPRSKLLSLESRLDYQIALPQEIKLIPNIGFKYEYERSKTHQEQIDSNVSIAHAKKSYQAFSTAIGSRVIFTPIKFTDNKISTMSITPTAHFSIERRIGSRGASNTLNVTYQELGQTIWAGSVPANAKTAKTSVNAGIGLIASHKNIKLELLYDHTRQKRFKAHQGILKLKVNF